AGEEASHAVGGRAHTGEVRRKEQLWRRRGTGRENDGVRAEVADLAGDAIDAFDVDDTRLATHEANADGVGAYDHPAPHQRRDDPRRQVILRFGRTCVSVARSAACAP